MRKNWNGLVAASTLLAGLAAATALYAQDEPATRQNPMGQSGMMQDGRGMMDKMNMMGQMGQMGQMGEMMETCNKMMKDQMTERNSKRPNEQWRDREPHQQENKE